jgi:hypothetical protein
MRQSSRPYQKYASNEQSGKLASDSFKARTRTYFFDIREAKSGKPYLMVTESRYDRGSGARERSRLIIYPDDVQGFQDVFQDMVQNLIDLSGEEEPAPRKRSFGNRRPRYPRQQSFDDYDPEDE